METAPICPYCNSITVLRDSRCIYGRSYGYIYLCGNCDAYCGVHKGTVKPLGTPANKELRALRKEAHRLLDPLWQSGKFKRKHLYKQLTKDLNLSRRLHVGATDKTLCTNLIKILKDNYYL